MTRTFTGEQIIVPSTDDAWEEIGFWEDLRFPGNASGADTSTGRIFTDYDEGLMAFATNARYDEEPWVMNVQLPHGWVEGSPIRPHLHWMQEEDNDPNWIICYRGAQKGIAINAVGASFTPVKPSTSRVYTYTSRIHQITGWAETVMTGWTVSDMLQIILYRDSANISTLFSGADPYTVDAKILEFDIHILMENLGSPNEYFK